MNRTTTTAATLGGAVGVLIVWVQSLFGLDVPPEVAAAEATICTGVFGLVFPR